VAALAVSVVGLEADHEHMAAVWARLRTTLLAWAAAADSPADERTGTDTDSGKGTGTGTVDETMRQSVAEFRQRYAAHIAVEEGVVFPAASARMSPAQLAAMSADMQARRRVQPS
jgi:hypothetical protein